MRTLITILAVLAFQANADTDNLNEITADELAHIEVQEWGVITWSGGDPVVTASSELPDSHSSGEDDVYQVRAPVIYINGPEFEGTVTVRTDNGSIFDIYPQVSNCQRTHNSVSWTASFSNERIEEYPAELGTAPGEWNYNLWRVDPALTVSIGENWTDKFLYYETAPETLDFLPWLSGAESVSDEYASIPVMVFRNGNNGAKYCICTMRDFVYGGSMEFKAIEERPLLMEIISWSAGILEPEQADAMWKTWSSWIMNDHTEEPAYRNGMVLYMIPPELTGRISSISVRPDGTGYPVDYYRCILAAIPL